MFSKLKIFFELIKFEHTVFALPFAYLGMVTAARGLPSFAKVFWVTVAMAGARTAAMTLNRLIDRHIDARNPRTQNRSLVTGRFSVQSAWVAVGAALAAFFLAAGMLNPLCFRLSFFALFFMTGYHYVKRFSWLCHFALGFVLAMAPAGGWLAVTGSWSNDAALLSAGVLFWVAGFDVLYSLQDHAFDRSSGLHSIPVRFGGPAARGWAKACHAVSFLFFALFGVVAELGPVYAAGVAVTGTLFIVEHALLRDDDLSHIQTAFFTVNGWIGLLLFAFTFVDVFR